MTHPPQFQLDRLLTIGARPETVFSFFTDSARWAGWWGAGSTIDARVGGAVRIVLPGGVEVSGEVLQIHPPDAITFTYGYASGTPIGPGMSTVTIRLTPHPEGTHLHLTHEFADAGARDQHVQGWRFQLALFANAVANLVHGDAQVAVDNWFGAWNSADSATRFALLSTTVTPDVRFSDRFSRTDGIPDLNAHLEAARQFMPGVVLVCDGAVRHCQGVAIANWHALKDNASTSSGINVFDFNADGRIRRVTGFWI